MTFDVGDQYVIEWMDGDRQQYRVEELRRDSIVCRRWIESKGAWTPWLGVQKLSEIKRLKVSRATYAR